MYELSVAARLQLLATAIRESSPALSAVAADFQSGNNNVEATVALDLSLEAVEEIAFKFQDFPTAEAGHVDVITLRAPFIKMLLPLHMHQVEFVYESVPLQQLERPIYSNAVDARIDLMGMPENLRCIQMLFRSLNHAKNSFALVGQSQATGCEGRLQSSGGFTFRKRHIAY